MIMLKTANIKHTLFTILFIELIASFLSYWIFGFEIALLFTICLSVAWLSAAFVGLENVIIRTKQELKGELDEDSA
jgi:hypothetical protein